MPDTAVNPMEITRPEIPRDRVMNLIRDLLGFDDLGRIVSISIVPDVVRVEFYAVGEDGKWFRREDEIARDVINFPIEGGC